MRFIIVCDDFFCDELRSQYCKGMQYTLDPHNEVLTKLVAEWVESGKAEMLDTEAEVATISGG